MDRKEIIDTNPDHYALWGQRKQGSGGSGESGSGGRWMSVRTTVAPWYPVEDWENSIDRGAFGPATGVVLHSSRESCEVK